MVLGTVNLCILGCGTLGSALLKGILENATEETRVTSTNITLPISACVQHEESGQKLNKQFGSFLKVSIGNNVEAVDKANVVILGVKPQAARNILSEKGMAEALKGKLLISLCAGVKLSQLKDWAPHANVIRTMPNTPCQVREGMTAVCCPPGTDDAHRDFVHLIFSKVGRVRFIEENLIDAVTSLSGSGVAFACVVLEAFADGGVMMGLKCDVAREFAAQTFLGAAKMILETGQHPAAIKDAVTTPAGCTIAGLFAMEEGKIRHTLANAIQEATHVASSLGQGK